MGRSKKDDLKWMVGGEQPSTLGASEKPRFFEKFLGRKFASRKAYLDVRAREQIYLTTKLPEKMVFQRFL